MVVRGDEGFVFTASRHELGVGAGLGDDAAVAVGVVDEVDFVGVSNRR